MTGDNSLNINKHIELLEDQKKDYADILKSILYMLRTGKEISSPMINRGINLLEKNGDLNGD